MPKILLHLLAVSIILVLPLHNCLTYDALEHERREMNQRARENLEQILSTEEFKAPQVQQAWWHSLLDRFFRRLPDEIRWLSGILEWLFYFFIAVLIVLIIILAARRFRRLPSFTADQNAPMEQQSYMTPETVKAKAYEYLQTGDHRQAIRYLYLSLLLYLNKAGLLVYEMGKTDGEYVGEIRRNMARESERFTFLTALFERKWYGTEESSIGDFRQCEEIFDSLTGSET